MTDETQLPDNNETGTEPTPDIIVSEEDEATGGIPNKRDSKGRLLPGHGGGPGRPKGKSLKEYWKQRFSMMTDEEKEEFSKKVVPEMLWKMAEGMPKQDTELSGELKVIPIYGNQSIIQRYDSNPEDIQPEETN
jgi:hypothetical protein